MLKSLEKAATADDEIHKRDCEIRRLREQLTSMDDEGIRIDSDLQSSIKKLQHDKESAINEGRILLTQLSRRDEEVVLQSKEIEKLKSTISHLSYQQANSLKEMESLRAAKRSEVSILQEKLQNALATGHAKEVELVSSTEKCNGFDQERQSLLNRLHQAEERAALASQRAEKLEVKLANSTQERVKPSDEIAEQMVEQLKRLAAHVKDLETSMDKTALRYPLDIFQKKAVAASIAKLSNKLAVADATSMDSFSRVDSFGEPEKSESFPDREEKQRQVSFALPDENSKSDHSAQTGSSITNTDRGTAFTMLKKWITWKWRWAASAAKAENLLLQLKARSVNTEATELASDEGDDLTVTRRILPVMMMAWRVFTRLSNLEKSANARNESLKKITLALPWWIRRVGERRALERFFFNWLILSLRANRVKVQQKQQTQKKQVSLSRPAPPSTKPAIHQSSQAASTAALPSPVKTIYRNAEAQTETSAQTPDADPKQERSSTRLRPMIIRTKTETRTARLPVQKSDTRKKPGTDTQRLGRNQESKNGVTAEAPPTRQLRGFQNSFQQELKELQEVLSPQMDSVDQIPAQRPSTAYRALTANTQADPDPDPAKQALKSVFTVCTSLAQALSEVRAQLSGASERGGRSVSKDTDSSKQQSMGPTTHHYAQPIRRFKSPQRQQSGEALSTVSREPWPSWGDPTGTSQAPTVRQPHENFTNQLQRFQETTDNMYKSFRNGRGYQQVKGRPLESSRGPRREPVRGENENNYDRRNARVDFHPYANTSGRYSNPQTGREDNNQLRSGGPEKGRILLPDAGRLGGRTRFRTSKNDDKPELGSSMSQAPPNCQHTTVVQIMNQDNNKIGEVSVHTHPLNGSGGRGTGRVEGVPLEPDPRSKTRTHSLHDDTTLNNGAILCSTQDTDDAHLRPSTAPFNRSRAQGAAMRPTSAPRLHQSTTPARERDALGPTMNFINSLRRKPCIGADYADLLRTEIIRLREDRLSLEDKSLQHTSPENHKDLPLIRRPGWRNVY
ncbi:hypothetical protein R1sor_009899 [Riccia sorocarpa]|uniref:Uncharacterized protein n=1 Tax=Riccia sorocarpa TaxID=122646 RepID=A0ABD3HWE0_9MARC